MTGIIETSSEREAEPMYRVTLTVAREWMSPSGRLGRTEDLLEVTVVSQNHLRAVLRAREAAEAALPAGEHP